MKCGPQIINHSRGIATHSCRGVWEIGMNLESKVSAGLDTLKSLSALLCREDLNVMITGVRKSHLKGVVTPGGGSAG